jgi:uncharacterized protein YkwD
MDDRTFDTLETPLTSEVLARRGALKGIVGAALAVGLGQLAPLDSGAKKRRKKKRKHKKRPGGGGPSSEEAILLGLINEHRAANGRAALTRHDQLDAAAVRHSQDEAEHTFSDHTGSDGSTPDRRIAATGYAFDWWGENIYYGGGSAHEAFDWWKNSAGHNANMLSDHFEEIGIARAFSSASGYWYWTTDFASPA